MPAEASPAQQWSTATRGPPTSRRRAIRVDSLALARSIAPLSRVNSSSNASAGSAEMIEMRGASSSIPIVVPARLFSSQISVIAAISP
jgi:hypothetical protein